MIVIVILVLFGGKKLPELARGLGKGIREFKDASEGIKQEISDQINNFEKDLESIDEDPIAQPKTSVSETMSPTDTTPSSTSEERAEPQSEKKPPQFTTPEGTYQHAAGPGVDSGQDSYYKYGYNDHFVGEAPSAEKTAEQPSETTDGETTEDDINKSV